MLQTFKNAIFFNPQYHILRAGRLKLAFHTYGVSCITLINADIFHNLLNELYIKKNEKATKK